MANMRAKQPNKIREYQRIKDKYKRRKNLIGKYNSEFKEKSKHGMKLLRKEGRLREEKNRSKRNMDELFEFGEYASKSKDNLELLELVEPDIVKKINEKNRAEKEKRLKEKEDRKRSVRWEELLYNFTRSPEEEEEFREMQQLFHDRHSKDQKERLMKMIKELDREYLAEDLDYWFEYHKLATTDLAPEWRDIRNKIYEDHKRLDPNFVEKVEAWTYNSRWMKRQKVLMETKVLNDDYNRQTDKSDQNNGFEGSESLCENETAREENIRERMKVECVKKGPVNSAEENVKIESFDRKTDNQGNDNQDSQLCE